LSTTTTPRKGRAKSKAKTLVGIVRVSSTRRRTGDSFISPQLQVEGMREWIERHPDYRLPDELILEEYDVSGARPLAQRPGLSRALELIEDGAADGVIGVRLDRIARSPEVWGELQRRVRAVGGVIVAPHHGGIRGDLPEEELLDDVSQSFAKYEVTRARRVFKLARERAIERGVAVFTEPAGYDKISEDGDPRGPKGSLVPNEDAAAVHEAFRLRAAGSSYNEIARFLDEHNVRTRSRRARHSDCWSRTGVTRLLSNRTYLGELQAGGLVNAHAHQAIVDEATFLTAQRPFPSYNGRESRHGFWLSKVTRCAGCGGALVGSHVKPKDVSYPIYRCTTRGCSAPATISARRLETFAEERLLDRAGTIREEDTQPLDDSRESLEVERHAAQRELDAWRQLPIADLDPAFYSDGLRERRERLDTVLEAIGHLDGGAPVAALSASLPDDWPTMTVEERRTIARAALARVEVRKGARSVPIGERIAITFAA
jgi:DNA invertase Pin-like site-specific DNA recombinase